MNQSEKLTMKAQLQAISSSMQMNAQMAMTGSSMPIMTPMGPAGGGGLVQVGVAISQQVAQTQELIKLVTKIVESL